MYDKENMLQMYKIMYEQFFVPTLAEHKRQTEIEMNARRTEINALTHRVELLEAQIGRY